MRRSRLAFTLVVSLLAGCEGCTYEDVQNAVAAPFPTLESVRVEGARHETAFAVHVVVMDPVDPDSGFGVSQVVATITSLADASFTGSVVLTEVETLEGGVRMRGQMPALPLGLYELTVEGALEHDGEPAPEDAPALVHTDTVRVTETEACFTFAEQENTEAWTLDGLWDIQTSASEPDGTLTSVPLPESCDLTAFDGAAVAELTGCFASSEPESGHWGIDFVSPELGTLPDWESAAGVAFFASLSGSGLDDGGEVQPIVTTSDAVGQTTSYAPGTTGNRVFYSLPDGGFQWLFSPEVDESYARARVRIFLDPMEALQGESVFLTLGAFCPISGP